MGQRMKDEPIVYGADCLRGFDADKTPKYIYIRFSQIVKCPDWDEVVYQIPPNDRVFKLTQDDVHPCLWEVTTTGWHVIFDLQFDYPDTIVWLEYIPDGKVYFFDVVPLPVEEGIVFHNNNTDCLLGRSAHGGIATVTWTPQATDILEAINMKKAYDLFMELRPLEDGKLVYKFCRLQDATNIKILFEP